MLELLVSEKYRKRALRKRKRRQILLRCGGWIRWRRGFREEGLGRFLKGRKQKDACSRLLVASGGAREGRRFVGRRLLCEAFGCRWIRVSMRALSLQPQLLARLRDETAHVCQIAPVRPVGAVIESFYGLKSRQHLSVLKRPSVWGWWGKKKTKNMFWHL